MRSLITAALVFFLSGGAAFAQAEPRQTPVAARLHFLAVTPEEPENLYLLVNGEPVSIRAPRNHLPPPVAYSGPPVLALYRKGAAPAVPPPPPPGGALAPAPAPVPVATVALPAAGGDFLVVLGGDPAAPRMVLRDFSPSAAPVGGYMVMNLTRRGVGVVLGGAKSMVPAGGQALLRPGDGTDGYMAFSVYDDAGEGRARRLFAARHYHVAETRQLVFLTDPEGAEDRVRVKIVTQRAPPPPRATPAPQAAR